MRPCWKDPPVPEAFPAEFCADVIAVARKGEAPLRQIAKDFGGSAACLHRWLKIADREDGIGLRR
jgi:transposase-like protein